VVFAPAKLHGVRRLMLGGSTLTVSSCPHQPRGRKPGSVSVSLGFPPRSKNKAYREVVRCKVPLGARCAGRAVRSAWIATSGSVAEADASASGPGRSMASSQRPVGALQHSRFGRHRPRASGKRSGAFSVSPRGPRGRLLQAFRNVGGTWTPRSTARDSMPADD